MSFEIDSIEIGGKEFLPVLEGGKGVSASDGATSGAFASCEAIGTFSSVTPVEYNQDDSVVPLSFSSANRKDRHEEFVQKSIDGSITQAQKAKDIAGGKGRVHVNILWELGGSIRILESMLSRAPGVVDGITCGAGMPYKVAEIAAKHSVHYFPIVSSVRAFSALWKRAYHKFADFLGGVVYEDPWLAGGHNGLSNAEDPKIPQDPYPRIVELRKLMNQLGLNRIPIIMAGGVWYLREWKEWLNNKEIGKIAFQFGTRPLFTKESPISQKWKDLLFKLKEGDIFLNKFSPTGFYSSAVKNSFMKELEQRNNRQVEFKEEADAEFSKFIPIGNRGRGVFVKEDDHLNISSWITQGFTEAMKTPDKTLIFVEKERESRILKDQSDCRGCLSACKFSNWMDHGEFNIGRQPDPRSFCIHKTLTDAIRHDEIDDALIFAGHNASRFAGDPFYQGGNFMPTIKQLVDRIMTGD